MRWNIWRPRTHHLFHDGIERATAGTLNAQKVPLPVGRLDLAIVAHDIHHALQIGRHGVFGNISGPRLPGRRHALLTDDGLFANGAAIVKSGEFAEAVCMNRVTCCDNKNKNVRERTSEMRLLLIRQFS